jgi:hypothetical protein
VFLLLETPFFLVFIHPFVQKNQLARQNSLLPCKEIFLGHHPFNTEKILPQILDLLVQKRQLKTNRFDLG